MDGIVKVSVRSLMKKYMAVMPQDFFFDLNSATLKGVKTVFVKSSVIADLDKALVEKKEKDKWLRDCSVRNNRGIEHEKNGKVRLAVKAYEDNIKEGCYPACHAFDRLMIIYRKQKDFENEIRVIDRAIDVLCPRYPDLLEKYSTRKIKAQALLGKNKQ